MRTVKRNPFLSGCCAILGGILLWAGAARADVSSTNAAAILVFPKLVLDTSTSTTKHTDTVIQLTNTAPNPVNVRCFLVDANGHCSNNPLLICNPNGEPADITSICGPTAGCVPGWQETDFAFRLTANQPIEWEVSDGLPVLPLDPTAMTSSTGHPANGQSNSGSISGAQEDPMVGELKCIEVDDSEAPTDHNDLKGEATIETVNTDGSPTVDTRAYNAIGIQAIAGANNNDDTLVLGQEYNACPAVLLLDSFFDDAEDPVARDNVHIRTHLTLVPCSEDFNFQAPIKNTVQYLVFNEFEQRLSTSRPFTCFSEITLSDIDTHPGAADDANSIFNVNVEGTLTGQTVIRGVADNDTTHGHGVLGVAEEFHGTGSGTTFVPKFSAAFALVQRGGGRTQNDIISLPPANVTGP